MSLLRGKGTDESSEVPCWDWVCGLCSSKGVLAEVLAFTFGLVPLNLDHISPADMVFRDSDGQTFAQLPEDTSPFRVQKEHDGATGATGDSWRCSVLHFVLSLTSCHHSCWGPSPHRRVLLLPYCPRLRLVARATLSFAVFPHHSRLLLSAHRGSNYMQGSFAYSARVYSVTVVEQDLRKIHCSSP